MSYKIAIASSDLIHINLNFGGATDFLIYEVMEEGNYSLLEIRNAMEEDREVKVKELDTHCISSCHGFGVTKGLCSDTKADSSKVLLISDCRCVICKKVGLHIQKQLEKKAIITFDVEGEIRETLDKITHYFNLVDHHHTLRGISKQHIMNKNEVTKADSI